MFWQHRAVSWLGSLLLLVSLLAMTFVVSQQQNAYELQLHQLHTSNISAQASRRLQIFVDSHLRVARIFARRWATHPSGDFSKQRFDEFATVVLDEFPGFRAMWMVSLDPQSVWRVGRAPNALPPELNIARRQAIENCRKTRQVSVSSPIEYDDNEVGFYAVLPLERDTEIIGFVLIDFTANTLINDCFHEHIRSEFDFVITDVGSVAHLGAKHDTSSDAVVLYATNRQLRRVQQANPAYAEVRFAVHDRNWELVMLPRQSAIGAAISWRRAALPVFGLTLSVCLSALFLMLLRRIRTVHETRDQVIHEYAERERAEAARRASDSRYHSVFDAATDGLLVVKPDAVITRANPTAAQMFGSVAESLVGRALTECADESFQQHARGVLHEVEAFGSARQGAVIQHADKGLIEIEMRATRLGLVEPTRWLIVLSDVTERNQALRRQAALSRKVLLAQEEERTRLSRELHDELGQLLTALRLEMGWLQKKLSGMAEQERNVFAGAVRLVETATDELRQICRGLRPPLLDDLGLEPAVRHLLADFEERTQVPVQTSIRLDEPPTISSELALCAYRVLQESLTNVRRHAQAKSVRVILHCMDSEFVLEVQDDGVGFEARHTRDANACGLEGMRERAHLVGGQVEVHSASFQGTRVVFRASIHAHLVQEPT